MKRLLTALAAAGIVSTAVFAAASTLAVDGGAIQVGTDNLLQCDTDGVSVSYNVDLFGTVTSVQVNDIESACEGNRLVVVLKDEAGTPIGTGGGLDPGTGGAPLTVQATPLFDPDLYNAPCDSTTCKVQIAPIDANGNYLGGHGVAGADIEQVTVMIEGDNGL
jgi:hypothetical protein